MTFGSQLRLCNLKQVTFPFLSQFPHPTDRDKTNLLLFGVIIGLNIVFKVLSRGLLPSKCSLMRLTIVLTIVLLGLIKSLLEI